MEMEKTETGKTAGKTIRCRAAICRKAGESLVIEEIEVAPPKAWEVRIKILCTSLCHSDLTFWKMPEPRGFYPRIFGHEAVGIVESIGDKVDGFKERDVVVPFFFPNCEDCVDCKSGKSNVCSLFPFKTEPGMPRDGTSRFTSSSGEVVHNFLSTSTFVEYTVVDIVHLVKLGHDIPIDKACLLGCGISTGIGAAWKVADVQAGSTVAIFGLGAVGLAVAEGARLRGASKIIGIDLNPQKFDIGKKFGLTDFINPNDLGEKSISEVVIEMTGGGADYCFECIGLASLMNEAFTCSRSGWGKTVILGVEMHGAPLSVNPYHILRGRTISGSFFGGITAKSDIPMLAKSYYDKELNLEGFISHEIGFNDINKAFDLLTKGESVRCMIWMNR